MVVVVDGGGGGCGRYYTLREHLTAQNEILNTNGLGFPKGKSYHATNYHEPRRNKECLPAFPQFLLIKPNSSFGNNEAAWQPLKVER